MDPAVGKLRHAVERYAGLAAERQAERRHHPRKAGDRWGGSGADTMSTSVLLVASSTMLDAPEAWQIRAVSEG